MKINRKTNVLMSLAAAALGMFAVSTARGQATITWGNATDITSDSDATNNGALVFAYDWNSFVATLNGVPFTAPGTNVTFNPASGMTGLYTGFVVGNNAAGTDASKLSLTYQDLLTGAQYGGTLPGLATLNGLKLGHNYEIEIWVDDSRSGEDTRSESISDVQGDSTSLQYNYNERQGGVGQFVVGTFTANETTNLLVLQAGAASQINMLQVRDLGAAAAAVAPVFSPAPGNYIGTQTVTITGESGSTIFYTTDGSSPSTISANGGVGTGTATVNIPLGTTVGINAMETNSSQTASAISQATYSTFSTPINPVWIGNGLGSWQTPNNWSNGIIANGVGVTADFSQTTVVNGTVVTLDGPVTVGNLIFADLANANSIEIDPGQNPQYGFAGSLTLAGPNPTITTENQSAIITAAIAGDNGLTVAGTGTLNLTNQNTYTGGTTVNGGATLFANGPNSSTGAVGTGDVTVLPGGKVIVGETDNAFVGSSPSDILAIFIEDGAIVENTNAFDAGGAGTANNMDAVVMDGGTLQADFTNLASGNWILDYGVYTEGDGKTSYINGGTLALSQSGGTVFEILGNDDLVISADLAHTGSADNGFIKLGTGTLTLNGTTNSTLGAEAVNGGTLNGNGQTSATLTVNSGGTLAPGTSTTIGQLGFTNLILKAGATVVMKINPTSGTNDSVVGDVGTPLNAVTYAGTLTVSNIGGTLALGDTYPLFSALKYNGAFSTYNLPTLPSGLHWNVGQLSVNGNLSVVSGPSAPTFNPTAGGFMTPQVITINDLTPGAIIYYTTDGSTPTNTSPIYSSGINLGVPGSLTIKAVAYVGGVASPVSTGSFVTSTTAVWSNNAVASASWSVPANWSNGIIANLAGGTADFSELTLSNAETVTLDGNWTIGNMIFGDKGNAFAYSITPGTGTTNLILAGSSPTITLLNSNSTAANANLQTTISANVGGNNGWTFIGAAIPSNKLTTSSAEIRLTAENIITGGTVVDGAAIYDNGGETSYGIFGRGNLLVTNGGSIICNGSYWSLTGADPSLVFTVTIDQGCTITNAGGQAQILPNLIMDGGTLSAGNGNGNGGYGAWGLTGNVTTMGDGLTSYILGGGPNDGDLSFLSEGSTVFDIGTNDTLVITAPFDFGWKNEDNGWTKTGPGTMEMDASIACQATNTGSISDGLFRGTATLINGPVFVNPGGTIGAGTATTLGTLSMSKSLTLSPGSTSLFRLNINSPTAVNDQINLTGSATVQYGGTLVVTNIGGPLAFNDSFTLFSFNNTAIGSFQNYVLPALQTGLSWDTSELQSFGGIRVISGSAAPTFSPPAGGYSGGAQQITITSSTPGATIYYTTNGSFPTSSSSSGISPVTITVPAGVTETVAAYASKAGYSPDSGDALATYTTEAGSAVWINPAGGSNSWSVASNWVNGIIANQAGGVADFSQETLTGNRIITLDGAWTTGDMIFGDVGNTYTTEIDAGTNANTGLFAGPLYLESGTTNPATITVDNGTAIIGANIDCLHGFNKTGPGTLLFTGNATNVWGHFVGPITTSGGPLIFSNAATEIIPPGGITGTGPLTFVGNGLTFLGNVTTGANQTYINNTVVYYEIDGDYVSTNCVLKATNGAGITFTTPCLGYKNSNGGSLTLDTSEGNGPINLDVSEGGNNYYFSMEYFIVNSGTGPLNYGGAYPNVNNPLYANVGDRVPPVESLTGNINFTANYTANVAILMYMYPTLPSTVSGVLNGSLTLTVGGPSTLTLTATNTYTSPTIVTNGGTLLVQGQLRGSAVTVGPGGTLGGTGLVGGPTTVLSGGTLEAGPVGTPGNLSMGDSVTLNPGSTTILRINAGNGQFDSISGPPIAPIVINFGGTLEVTNLGGTFVAGDSYQLFSAGGYNGNFSTTNLPTLTPDLAWKWSANNGTLSVVNSTTTGPTQPTLSTNVTKNGTSFTLNFSGASGEGYSVLETTNLALPFSSWTTLSSSTFGVSGNATYTDTAANTKTRFYVIKSP